MPELPARIARLAPLAGVVFAVLVYVAFFVSGDTAGVDDPPEEIVRFWTEERTSQLTGSYLVGLGALALVWFAGSLRHTVSRAEGGDGRLAAIAFAGALIMATALLLLASLAYAAADTAGKVTPEATQVLTVLGNELFYMLVGGGFLLLAASGLAILYTRVLPLWLGWVTLVLAASMLTPVAWIGFLLTMLWAAGVGVVLFIRG
ncbi:hypothetical protein [Longispora albida]|uniref:hypothetical protein n=1 Tax=Longispora albida TaxID=203523 RepID=UPI000364DBE8|nr:hypothetical protein [Longispora albida]